MTQPDRARSQRAPDLLTQQPQQRAEQPQDGAINLGDSGGISGGG